MDEVKNQRDENGNKHGYWEQDWLHGFIKTLGYYHHGMRHDYWVFSDRYGKIGNYGHYNNGVEFGLWKEDLVKFKYYL